MHLTNKRNTTIQHRFFHTSPKEESSMILKLDFSSDIPIYQQIRNQIVLSVADGTIRPGEKLPSMRTLAAESGINMMTVNKAYQLLKQEGYLIIDRRNGAVSLFLPTKPPSPL